MTSKRTYHDPCDDEGFLYVREWTDQQLEEEFTFLTSLYHAVLMEMAFRADHPEHRDGTATIVAEDSRLFELADGMRAELPVRTNTDPGERLE